MKIEGKTAIVTGGASGLGKATVIDLCKKGCKVVIADMDLSGEALSQELLNQGFETRFFKTNVASEENIIELVKYTVQEFKEIHILVNCAGKALIELTVTKNGTASINNFKNIFEINVYGTFYAAKHVGFQMIKQEKYDNGIRGVILNVSSITAEEGPAGLVAYASSKGALNGMTLPMARDLGYFGIRLITIAPGLFKTKMTEQQINQNSYNMSKSNVLERPGNPFEFSHMAVAFIENDFMTGTITRIDGGDKVMKNSYE